jgi:hypothetical protein
MEQRMTPQMQLPPRKNPKLTPMQLATLWILVLLAIVFAWVGPAPFINIVD